VLLDTSATSRSLPLVELQNVAKGWVLPSNATPASFDDLPPLMNATAVTRWQYLGLAPSGMSRHLCATWLLEHASLHV
jgi:hypothetical protein